MVNDIRGCWKRFFTPEDRRVRCSALTCKNRRYKSLPGTPALAGVARENRRGRQGDG